MNTGVGSHVLLQGSSRPRKRTRISCTGRTIVYHWATWEAQEALHMDIFKVWGYIRTKENSTWEDICLMWLKQEQYWGVFFLKIKSAGRVLTTDSVVLGRILLGFLFCRRKREKGEDCEHAWKKAQGRPLYCHQRKSNSLIWLQVL